MGVVGNAVAEEEEEKKAKKMQQQQRQEQEQQQQGGVLYVKVMTDEQLEDLRKQISIYATICEQLVQMHKALTAQQDSLSGMRLGNMYDPLITSGGHKMTSRQRWTPTPVQLQILENIFEQGNGAPSKQRIKEITSELAQHGQISETNVYNWFQNRRARSKRKQLQPLPNNAESEVETETDSPNEKKAKAEDIHHHENSTPVVDDLCFHSAEYTSEVHSLDPHPSTAQADFPLNDSFRSSGSMGHAHFYESMLSNPSM